MSSSPYSLLPSRVKSSLTSVELSSLNVMSQSRYSLGKYGHVLWSQSLSSLDSRMLSMSLMHSPMYSTALTLKRIDLVLFVNLYAARASENSVLTAFCIVSLYRSVSRIERAILARWPHFVGCNGYVCIAFADRNKGDSGPDFEGPSGETRAAIVLSLHSLSLSHHNQR